MTWLAANWANLAALLVVIGLVALCLRNILPGKGRGGGCSGCGGGCSGCSGCASCGMGQNLKTQ